MVSNTGNARVVRTGLPWAIAAAPRHSSVRFASLHAMSSTPAPSTTTTASIAPAAAAKPQQPELLPLEEDDEFEDFAAEGPLAQPLRALRP